MLVGFFLAYRHEIQTINPSPDTATRLGSMDDLMSLVSTKSPSPSPNRHGSSSKSVTWSQDSYESDNQLSALRRQLKDVQEENISHLRELVNVRKDMNKVLESSVEEQRLHLAQADMNTTEERAPTG